MEKYILILINLIAIVLISWVYLSNKKEKTNQWFGIMCVFLTLWIDFAYLGRIAETVASATLWYRLNFGAVILSLLSAYYFYVLYFAKQKGKHVFWERFITASCALLFLLAVFTDLIIGIPTIEEWGADIKYGNLGVIYNFYTFFVALVIVYYLLRDYFSFPELEKSKTLFFLLGTFIAIVSNIVFNIIYPTFIQETSKYQFLGDYSVVFIFIFTGYAILSKQLFGIKVILSQILVGIITIMLLWYAVIAVPDWTEFAWRMALLLLILILGYLLIRSIKQEIKKNQEIKKLSSKLTQANEEINKLKKIEVKLFDFKDYFGKTEQKIKAQLKPASIKFLLYDSRYQEFQEKYPDENRLKISNHDHLISCIRSEKTFIITDKLDSLMNKEKDLTKKGLLASVKEGMSKINASIIIPLYSPEDNELIALGILGAKKNKKAYTKEEIESLHKLTKEASHIAAHALAGYQTSERLKEFQRGL